MIVVHLPMAVKGQVAPKHYIISMLAGGVARARPKGGMTETQQDLFLIREAGRLI
jgi:hypothetical protein